jgi:hypothetical protein
MQGAPAPHQKVPVFPGCHVDYSLRLPDATRPCQRVNASTASALANKGEGCGASTVPPQTSDAQPPLLLGPVFPGCHRKRVITPP